MNERSIRLRGIGALNLLLLVAVLALVPACGGGSGGTQDSNAGASASQVRFLMEFSQEFPAGSVASIERTAAPAAEPTDPAIDGAWITVERVALIPGADTVGPDPAGETPVEVATLEPAYVPEEFGGIVSANVVPPIEVDLLNLTEGQVATLLNAIKDVPSGTYGKVRLYYTDPKVHFVGAMENTVMQGTAHFHLDIHFVDGGLVVEGSAVAGTVMIHDVSVKFVVGGGGPTFEVQRDDQGQVTKILIRPQVFAVVSAVQSAIVVAGIPYNLNQNGDGSGSFDVWTVDGVPVPVSYTADTYWAFLPGPGNYSSGYSGGPIDALSLGQYVEVSGQPAGGAGLVAQTIFVAYPSGSVE